MGTNLVQKILRDVALSAGFIDKENNGHEFNPLSPHALRESFGSIMISNGVPDTIVDFWLGHKIGDMAEAYKGREFDDLKRMYLERETFISISAPTTNITEIERQLQKQKNTISNLAIENTSLKERLSKLEKMADEGMFYISKFKEEFDRDSKKAARMYFALTLYMNEHWQEMAQGEGLTDNEIHTLEEELSIISKSKD